MGSSLLSGRPICVLDGSSLQGARLSDAQGFLCCLLSGSPAPVLPPCQWQPRPGCCPRLLLWKCFFPFPGPRGLPQCQSTRRSSGPGVIPQRLPDAWIPLLCISTHTPCQKHLVFTVPQSRYGAQAVGSHSQDGGACAPQLLGVFFGPKLHPSLPIHPLIHFDSRAWGGASAGPRLSGEESEPWERSACLGATAVRVVGHLSSPGMQLGSVRGSLGPGDSLGELLEEETLTPGWSSPRKSFLTTQAQQLLLSLTLSQWSLPCALSELFVGIQLFIFLPY